MSATTVHMSDGIGMPACGASRRRKTTILAQNVTCQECRALVSFKRDVADGIVARGAKPVLGGIYRDAYEIDTIIGKLHINLDVSLHGWVAQRFEEPGRHPGSNPHSGKWNWHPDKDAVLTNPLEAARGYLASLDDVLPRKAEHDRSR